MTDWIVETSDKKKKVVYAISVGKAKCCSNYVQLKNS